MNTEPIQQTEQRDPIEEACLRVFQSARTLAGSLTVVLLVALLWRLLTFAAPERTGYDEAVYRAYAQLIGERGMEGLRAAVAAWPDNEFLNKGSLPYRLFYLLPCTGICKLLGGYTTSNLAVLSLIFGLATVVVVLLLARRWVGPVYGMLTTLLVAVSPLGTMLSRRALQDTCFAFVVAVSLLFFDRCLRGERRRSDLWWLGVALVAGFLTKETMLFLYPAFLLAGLCYVRNGWRDKVPIAIPFIVAPLIHLAVVVWLSGGLQACLNTYRSYAAMQKTIPYALQFQNGPWFRYLVDLMLLSPLAVVLAVIGAASPSRCPRAVLVFMLAALAVMSVISILNVRFILFLDPCLRVYAVLGVMALVRRIPGSWQFQCALAAILFVMVVGSDLFQFYRLFEAAGVYDPVTAELIRANGFIR